MADEVKTGVKKAGAEGSSGIDQKSPEIVVKNNAFQMAQAWVKKMSGGADSDPEEQDSESKTREKLAVLRPARLGLGAKYLPHSKAAALMIPVEKKLRAKINAARRGDSTADQDHPPSYRDTTASTTAADSDEEGGNEGKESKAAAFGRKQRNTAADLLMPSIKAGKRKRLGR